MLTNWTPQTPIETAIYDAYTNAQASNKPFVVAYKNAHKREDYIIETYDDTSIRYAKPQLEASKSISILASLTTRKSFQEQWPYDPGEIKSVADLRQHNDHSKSLDAQSYTTTSFNRFNNTKAPFEGSEKPTARYNERPTHIEQLAVRFDEQLKELEKVFQRAVSHGDQAAVLRAITTVVQTRRDLEETLPKETPTDPRL